MLDGSLKQQRETAFASLDDFYRECANRGNSRDSLQLLSDFYRTFLNQFEHQLQFTISQLLLRSINGSAAEMRHVAEEVNRTLFELGYLIGCPTTKRPALLMYSTHDEKSEGFYLNIARNQGGRALSKRLEKESDFKLMRTPLSPEVARLFSSV